MREINGDENKPLLPTEIVILDQKPVAFSLLDSAVLQRLHQPKLVKKSSVFETIHYLC